MLYSHCSLYLDVKIGDQIVECLIDTGAQSNVMSEDMVKRLQLESFVDRNFKATVVGVGQSTINGIIPYIELTFDNNVTCPICIHIIESVNMHCILGFPFMLFYQLIFDYKKCEVTIMNQKYKLRIVENS